MSATETLKETTYYIASVRLRKHARAGRTIIEEDTVGWLGMADAGGEYPQIYRDAGFAHRFASLDEVPKTPKDWHNMPYGNSIKPGSMVVYKVTEQRRRTQEEVTR